MDISYLITIYNKENEIRETISFIQNQENIDSLGIEIVCVDDLSSDNSIKVLQSLQREDSRIKIINNQINLGPAKSINLSLIHI